MRKHLRWYLVAALLPLACSDQESHTSSPDAAAKSVDAGADIAPDDIPPIEDVGTTASVGPFHLEHMIEQAKVEGSLVPDAGNKEMVWTFPANAEDWRPLSYTIPAADAPDLTPTVESLDEGLRLTMEQGVEERFAGLLVVDVPELATDDWQEVQVRMRSTGLRSLGLGFNLREDAEVAAEQPSRFSNGRLERWGRQTAVADDGAVNTYRLSIRSGRSRPMRTAWKQLVLSFSGGEAWSADIESVTLLPGSSEYDAAPVMVRSVSRGRDRRHSIAFHAPGSLSYTLEIPAAGRLDAAVGTLSSKEEITFRARLVDAAGTDHMLWEQACRDASGWTDCNVDLSAFGGQTVTMVLEGASQTPGAVGFWAAPIITGATGPERPNVILYIIDGGGADLMSVYGYDRKTTPNLNRLAEEGTVFDLAHTNSGWTKSSTASFMTSLHHSVLGGYTNMNDQIPAQAITMAQRFHEVGYQTAVFTSNPFAGSLSGLQRDVDVFRDQGAQDNSASSEELHQQFYDWREEWPGQPYWVHFQTTDVHEPHEPSAPYAGLFVTPEEREKFEGWWRQMRRARGGEDTVLGSYRKKLHDLGIDDKEFFNIQRGLYDETMAHNDHEIGKLVEYLKANGEWENTILIIGADHGHPAGSFSRFGRGLLEPAPEDWEGALADSYRTHIPLMVFWPGHVPAGQRIRDRVSMIDVLPTVLELAGLPQPLILQGQSLVPLIEGDEGFEPMPVIFDQFQADRETGLMAGHIEMIEGRWAASLEIVPDEFREAYRKGERELVTSGGHRTPRPHRHTTPQLLLYDLVEDPFCTRNVNDEHPELVEEFTRRLREQWKAHDALIGHFSSGGSEPMSAEQLETLRALGYIR